MIHVDGTEDGVAFPWDHESIVHFWQMVGQAVKYGPRKWRRVVMVLIGAAFFLVWILSLGRDAPRRSCQRSMKKHDDNAGTLGDRRNRSGQAKRDG